jgi:hypothetical protein
MLLGLSFLWAAGPESRIEAGPRGSGDGGQHTIPVPVVPDGDNFSPDYIPAGINFVPSPSPNRGIHLGESGIGSLLPSLFVSSTPQNRS